MSRTHSDTSAAASWGSAFAGVMLLVVGACQFLQGLVAVVNGNDFFVATPRYVFQFNASTWGWIHLVVGVVVAVAGYFIFTGNAAARGFGIFLAGGQAIVNFLWLPYYPVWGTVIIAIDVFVIWSLATSRLTQRP